MASTLVYLVVALHFAFMGFLLVGGYLACHWRGLIYPHLAVGVWAILSLTIDLTCPLTVAENYLREQAGMPLLETGFIDHYIDGVWYPQSATLLVQLVLGTIVITSWIGFVTKHRSEQRLNLSERSP